MKEYQIVVFKDSCGNMWYTAQKRIVCFLFRGVWKKITPMNCSKYEEAEILINNDKK